MQNIKVSDVHGVKNNEPKTYNVRTSSFQTNRAESSNGASFRCEVSQDTKAAGFQLPHKKISSKYFKLQTPISIYKWVFLALNSFPQGEYHRFRY